MCNVIVGVRTNDYKLIMLCGISSRLTGIIFGVALSSILSNI